MSRPAALEVTAEEWHQDALGIIAQYAEQRLPFAADEIHHHLPEPHDPNAWGRAFSAARGRGLIVRTGYTTSRTRSRKGGVVAVWIGKATS